MPPEAFGGKVDARGDIYALGLTLYEMLALRPAFDERERARLIHQVTGEAPPPVRKLNPEVPRDLETIVQKAIEREASHRYPSASELADDLRRFVDDEPIRARRASIAERIARWGRRNPMAASLAATAALLLFAVIAGLAYGYEASKQALIVQTKLRAAAELEKQKTEREKQNAELATTRESEQKAIAIAEKQRAESANRSLLSSQDALRSTLYAAQMNLAKVAWESGSPERTLDLLAATVPGPREPDPRGFEWHYWRRKVHGERTVHKLPGFGEAGIWGRVFSPDGRLAACLDPISDQSRSRLRSLLVYETTTGRLLRRIPFELPSRHPIPTGCHAVATSGDGNVVAIRVAQPTHFRGIGQTKQDWHIHTFVWNLRDLSVLFHQSEVINTPLASAAICLNGDGSRIAIVTSTFDQSAPRSTARSTLFRVLAVGGGHEYLRLTFANEGLFCVALSADGRLVATATRIQGGPNLTDLALRLKIVEVETGRVRMDSLDPKSSVGRRGLQFSPDGHRLAAITSHLSSEGSLTVVDVEQGQRVGSHSLPKALAFSLLAFSADGRRVVIASPTGPAAEVRDVETGQFVRSFSLAIGGARDIVICRSDGRLLTINDGDLRDWDILPPNRAALEADLLLKDIGTARALMARNLDLTLGGRRLIVAKAAGDWSMPTDFVVHDVATGEVTGRFPVHEPGTDSDPGARLGSIRSNSNGTMLAAVICGGPAAPIDEVTSCSLRIWDMTSGRRLLTLDHERLGGLLSSTEDLSPQAWNDAGTHLAVIVWSAVRGPDGNVAAPPTRGLSSLRYPRDVSSGRSTQERG